MILSRRRFVSLSAIGGAVALAGCRDGGEERDAESAATGVAGADFQISSRTIPSNGINMRIMEAGSGFPVIFLHGFAELAYSWRHQLPAIAAAGFHAIAPDLRGFGETDAPAEIEAYSTRQRAADVIGLLDALNAETCVLVGNDWGSGLAWSLAQLHPERIAGMLHLNIAYAERGDEPPTQAIARFARGKFNFALHLQTPGIAEREFEEDVRATMRRFLYAFSGDAPPETMNYLFMQKPANSHVLEGMPDPQQLPAWLTESDLDYYSSQYSKGFRGPVNMYRNMDRDWEELPRLGTGEVSQPVVFIGGRRDPSVIYAPFDSMIRAVPKLRRIVLLENCGHWVQQEEPAVVNHELIRFLDCEVRGRGCAGA